MRISFYLAFYYYFMRFAIFFNVTVDYFIKYVIRKLMLNKGATQTLIVLPLPFLSTPLKFETLV